MKIQKYRQCTLERIDKDTRIVTTTFIPNEYAVFNNIVKLLRGDVWIDNWRIIHVGHLTDEPLDSHNAIKAHRKNTGDSLPK